MTFVPAPIKALIKDAEEFGERWAAETIKGARVPFEVRLRERLREMIDSKSYDHDHLLTWSKAANAAAYNSVIKMCENQESGWKRLVEIFKAGEITTSHNTDKPS